MPEEIVEQKLEQPPMNFVSRFVAIFVSPRKVFADVDGGAPWWQPWVWVTILQMITAYVVLPIQIQLFRLTSDRMTKEQFDEALARMQSFPIKYLAIITSPITVIFIGVIFAAISFIAVTVLSERASFKKHLTIYLYSSIVASVGVLVSNIVVRLKGVENIRSFSDALAPFGPAALVPAGNKILYAMLSTLDIFSLWFYALIAIGVTQVFRMSWGASLLVVIPVWLLSALIALIGARFGGAM